ncbi:hypothetical protein N9N26_01115 [Candidatus Poseidoniales archaeon]|jgi:hypothetical protein|nr:hypothetical protein [Candidatus Poseidoniales archaeon]
MPYTEDDLGKTVSYETERGSYIDERIVMVYCSTCSARFIGPIREAGGFLGGHDIFHTWEIKRLMDEDGGLTA